MHLVVLHGSMITHHVYGIDKDQLLAAAIGRHFTELIIDSRTHTETLHKLSPEQKQQHLRE